MSYVFDILKEVGEYSFKIINQQNTLMDNLLANKFSPDDMLNSVWFHPATGRFLYYDENIRYEIVEPLIQDKRLKFKGIEKHQGLMMCRYGL